MFLSTTSGKIRSTWANALDSSNRFCWMTIGVDMYLFKTLICYVVKHNNTKILSCNSKYLNELIYLMSDSSTGFLWKSICWNLQLCILNGHNANVYVVLTRIFGTSWKLLILIRHKIGGFFRMAHHR